MYGPKTNSSTQNEVQTGLIQKIKIGIWQTKQQYLDHTLLDQELNKAELNYGFYTAQPEVGKTRIMYGQKGPAIHKMEKIGMKTEKPYMVHLVNHRTLFEAQNAGRADKKTTQLKQVYRPGIRLS